VVHLDQTRHGRQVASVGLMRDDGSGLVVATALESADGTVRAGPAWPALSARLGLPVTAVTGPWPLGAMGAEAPGQGFFLAGRQP